MDGSRVDAAIERELEAARQHLATVEEPKRLKRQWARLVRFLAGGGVLLREDIGGAVGVIWHAAARNVRVFEAAHCDDAIASGFVQRGRAFQLVAHERPDTWRAVQASSPALVAQLVEADKARRAR